MVSDAEWLSLEADERVEWWGQPRLRRILPAVARSLFWVGVFLAVAVVGPSYAPESVPGIAIVAGGVALAVLSTTTAIRAYLRTRNVYYVLTNRAVYLKRGVLSTAVTRIGAANIQNTELRKSVLGNLFDYGTIAISTAGSRGADLVVQDLDDPATFRAELTAVIRAAKPEPEPSSAGPALPAGAVDTLLAEVRTLRTAAERLEGAIAP